jgi:hypothetical protein
MEHYHRRSNVESTFSAIKRKFRHDVRSKCDFAIICVLIQEQCELGIKPIFWPEEARERVLAACRWFPLDGRGEATYNVQRPAKPPIYPETVPRSGIRPAPGLAGQQFGAGFFVRIPGDCHAVQPTRKTENQ